MCVCCTFLNLAHSHTPCTKKRLFEKWTLLLMVCSRFLFFTSAPKSFLFYVVQFVWMQFCFFSWCATLISTVFFRYYAYTYMNTNRTVSIFFKLKVSKMQFSFALKELKNLYAYVLWIYSSFNFQVKYCCWFFLLHLLLLFCILNTSDIVKACLCVSIFALRWRCTLCTSSITIQFYNYTLGILYTAHKTYVYVHNKHFSTVSTSGQMVYENSF